MAAGDLIVQNYQVEFNNWLGGAATEYIIERVEGFFGMGDIEPNDNAAGKTRGEYLGPGTEAGKTITFDVIATADYQEDMEAKMDFLGSVFAFTNGTIPLITMRPGKVKRFISAQARRNSFDSDYSMAHGTARGSVEFRCPDPRWYSLAEAQTTMVIPAGQASTAAVIYSDGLSESPSVRLELDGPCTNPRISNGNDSNRQMKFDLVMGAGDTLVVDVKQRTVLLNGVDVYKAVVRRDNQWWVLRPGNNPITYNRTGTTGSSVLDVFTRDAWNNP